YQYLNTSPYYTQAGSEFQAIVGISYRFALHSKSSEPSGGFEYYCPMHPEVSSTFPSTCPKCGMDLIRKE
ncbi:MAG TPA: heavy metal-binding domain-containing protein, partial [Saprospiraceae bacterium]|nr:heavy metal-binding domain-containing protein [Saprospiraceae bacterium]